MENKHFIEAKLRTVERVAAAVGLAWGLGMAYYLSQTNWAEKSIINSPSFFPNVISIALVVVSAIVFAYSYQTKPEKTVVVNPYGPLVCIVWAIYVVVMNYIGFILASMLVIAATMLIWGVTNRKIIVLASVIAPLVAYYLFGHFLHVRFITLFL